MTDREDAQESFNKRYDRAKERRDKKAQDAREYQKRMTNVNKMKDLQPTSIEVNHGHGDGICSTEEG